MPILRMLLALSSTVLAAGCSGVIVEPAAAPPASSPPAGVPAGTAPPPDGTVEGTFLPSPAGTTAVTYDPAVVPAGATARLSFTKTAQGVTVRLAVAGMVPRRSYGAHLHTMPCTVMPAAAGPHYQQHPDPAASASAPSVDPSYANPANEVWLDFTADARGAASATSAEDWAFDEAHPPRSLIVHAESTRTAQGVAGTAGQRVACLTVPRGRPDGFVRPKR
jgi:superoxide dismutase, Cu-Zn family